jgi:hypothetical protein
MTNPYSYFSTKPYIPASLSEIGDVVGSMVLGAPTFIDRLGDFPHRNIDSEFNKLTEGFALVRKRLGEERYARLIDLTDRAKALFAADQDDTNGKTDQGRELLYAIEDEIQAARRGRPEARPDNDGDSAGD